MSCGMPTFKRRRLCSLPVGLAMKVDVANAFNSIPVGTIVEALKFHDVPHYLQRLMEAYLQEREVLWEESDD
ncbi:unnamed protein product [Euphydryas editha]|uniref:Reverse transcriptase n=1 Tax=Euphydryas editha TaxID=104508 RepID=A0AAU9TEU5_EUPED|nr:unnamed protein product [Euphydryas editha]